MSTTSALCMCPLIDGPHDHHLSPARVVRPHVADDEQARCVWRTVEAFAARVDTDQQPAIKPPPFGMVRVSNRIDRAAYVWFLPCRAGTRAEDDGRVPERCNHGFRVDRQYGAFQVSAWVHGAPGVHHVELHATEITTDVLERVAALVGIPFKPEGL